MKIDKHKTHWRTLTCNKRSFNGENWFNLLFDGESATIEDVKLISFDYKTLSTIYKISTAKIYELGPTYEK
jgi:hypothetical protein